MSLAEAFVKEVVVALATPGLVSPAKAAHQAAAERRKDL